MKRNSVTFEDIVIKLKEDVNKNIFELCYDLNCSDGVIYRRLVSNGFRGLTPLKNAIKSNNL